MLNDHLPQKQGLRLPVSGSPPPVQWKLNDHLPQKQGLRQLPYALDVLLLLQPQ